MSEPETSRPDPLLGRVLEGTWRVTRLLGKGGMGRVYEAEHVRLERRFALKVIHEDRLPAPGRAGRDAVARFEREARAAARIRSDHVVDVVDTFETPDGRPCIVAELLDGEDLQTRLDRVGRLPPATAVDLARQLCRGLAAAHAHGVIHRDVKPSNLFLCAGADGGVTLKILDFGVAKLVGDPSITRAGAVVGTPSYMPPEQARGEGRTDPRADVYGAGAVLYRMLTGRPPYEGAEATQVLRLVTEVEPPPPRAIVPGLPTALEDVVLAALARDPRDRPADALELEARLARVAADLTRAPEHTAAWRGAERATEPAGTLVLPRGSVAAARAEAGRLLLSSLGALPSIGVAASAAAVGAGAAVAGCLLALGEPVPFGPTPTVLALAAAVALGGLVALELARARGTGPAARSLARRARVATVVGVGAYGAASASAPLVGLLTAGDPADTPGAAALRLLAAFVLALMAFGAAERAPTPGPEHAPTVPETAG